MKRNENNRGLLRVTGLCSLASIALVAFGLVAGCVSVPRLHAPQIPAVPATTVEKPTIIQKIFEPAKAAQIEQQNADDVDSESGADSVSSVPHSVKKSVAKPAAKTSIFRGTVETEVVLLWLAGLASLCLCGFCIYSGFYLPAIKFAVAGVLLPLFATWFAYHYILIIAVACIVAGLAVLWAERKTAIVQDALTESQTLLADAESKLEAGASAIEKKI